MWGELQQFLNDDQTVRVLNALVLIMVLLWLLTGGFGVHRGRRRRREDDRKPDGQRRDRDDREQ